MCAGAFKDNAEAIYSVDQQPVRFNMAFSPIPEIADQGMIPVFTINDLSFDQDLHDGLDMIRIAPPLDHHFQIFCKAI